MNTRYQDWLKHIFDHEVKSPEWYFELDAPQFEASPGEIAELLEKTFRSAGKDLKIFSDAQVDQGLWYVAGGSSNFIHELKSMSVPLEKLQEVIAGIFYLYADCFASRCDESLGHLSIESDDSSPLNSICYMFWDICALASISRPDKQEIQNAVLDVLRKTLTIEHRACREGALHGLGEMAFVCSDRVREIIDGLLETTKLDDELLAYALRAREGKVL